MTAPEVPVGGVQHRIQEVLRAHEIQVHYGHQVATCKCRAWDDDQDEPHATHVAPLVLALFNEEWCDDIGGPQWARYQRFVSEPVVHYGPRHYMSAVEDTE